MFQCDQCSYFSSKNYNLKRHERLKHYPKQCGGGVKRKHYPIQYEKRVEKNAEKVDKVTPDENTNNISQILLLSYTMN